MPHESTGPHNERGDTESIGLHDITPEDMAEFLNMDPPPDERPPVVINQNYD